MSRGLGGLQRSILSAFDELGGSGTVLDVAEHVHGELVAVGGPKYESTRRAVHSLCRLGFIRKFPGKLERKQVDWGDCTRWHDRFGFVELVERYEADWERDRECPGTEWLSVG